MSGNVCFQPTLLDAAARNALGLTQTLDEAGSAIRGVPLHGLEPSTRGRTEAAVQRAAALSDRACSTAKAQGPALRRRASLARRADSGGFAGALRAVGAPEAWKEFWKLPNGYDLTGYFDSLREGTRHALKVQLKENVAARDKLKYAKQAYYDKRYGAWRRHEWKSPEAMRKALSRPGNKYIGPLRRLEKKTRFLDPERLPGALGRNPIVKRVPLVSIGAGYAGGKAEGRSDADAAGKTAAQTAGSALGAGAGGLLCGSATVATLGMGAATCPVLIFAGGVVGDKVAGAVYDPVKKAAGKVADALRGKVRIPVFG